MQCCVAADWVQNVVRNVPIQGLKIKTGGYRHADRQSCICLRQMYARRRQV